MPPRFARFILQRRLGSGGSADVWQCHDPERGHAVALKIFRVSTHQDVRSRFLDEVQATRALGHRHIVRVWEAIEYQGRFALVLELCAGSMADWVNRDGAPSPWWVATVGIETLHALAHAHRRGLLHLDVKPANILFDQNGDIRLTDFGVARLLEHFKTRTSPSALWGTLPFVAPERRLGRRPDERSDLYSLAAALTWMATDGKLAGDLYVPKVADALASFVPPALHRVLKQACAYDPTERQTSADEMRAQLEHAREEFEPSPPPKLENLVTESPGLETESPCIPAVALHSVPSNRWLWVTTLTSAAAIAVAIVTVWSRSSPGDRAALLSDTRPPEAPLQTHEPPPCPDAIESVLSLVHPGPRETMAATARDLDGDGYVDLIFTNQLDASLSIYWGGSTSPFNDVTQRKVARSHARVAVGDIDGDGQVDLLTTHADASQIVVHLAVEPRRYRSRPPQFQSPAPANAALIDWDEDGHLDVLLSLREGEQCTAFRKGLGDGRFAAHECIGPVSTFLAPFSEAERSVWVRSTNGLVRVHRRDAQNQLDRGRVVWDPSSEAYALSMHGAYVDAPRQTSRGFHAVAVRGLETVLLRIRPAADAVETCVYLAPLPIPRAQFEDMADFDGDGFLDIVARSTCAECTSNHILLRGWRASQGHRTADAPARRPR